AAMYIKNNESLERWVDDLLKEFDNVMSVNLNTDLCQDNSRRVKELIKRIDDRLNQTITDDFEGLREEFSKDSDIIDETLCENGNADETISVNHSTDTTKVQQSAPNLPSNIAKKQPARLRVSRFIQKIIAKKSSIIEKDIPQDGCNYCLSSQETRTSTHDQMDSVKSRIENARRQNSHIVGTIAKRNKFERLLNGRYLIDKKDTIGEGHHGKPNLVPLLDLVETKQKVYYIMPLASKDLSDLIYRRRISEHSIRELMKPIFEAVKGRYPFEENQPISEQAVSNIEFPERRFKHYSSEAIDLIRKLLIFDPLRRISIDEALQHPFFTNG
ncbi:9324_t:CDS:2, partial [Racocetra fulgida]